MSKNKNANVEEQTNVDQGIVGQAQELHADDLPVVNRTLVFHRNHPKNRSSYTIAGHVGIFAVQRSLFIGTTEPVDDYDLAGMPPTLSVDVALVTPKVKAVKADKVEKLIAAAAAKVDAANVA